MAAELPLLLTVAFLAAALIVVLALGWYDSRSADRLANELDAVRGELAREQSKVRHLLERNEQLRDELDLSEPSEVSLTAEWLAFINRWPVLEDPR